MTSAALVPALQQHSGDPTAREYINGAKLDDNFAVVRARINAQAQATSRVIRSDDTLVDQVVRLRNLHPEILAEFGEGGNTVNIYQTGGGGSGSGGGGGTNPKDAAFGAAGDGVTIDTASINEAIEFVRDTYGSGEVRLPAGTYLVDIAKTADPLWKHAITLYPGITLRGESRESTIIKLKNGAGNYWSIFARATSSDTDMSDVGLYDLTIDQNNAGNVPAGLGDLTSPGCARFALVCYGGHRVTVKNCWFKNFKAINTLTFNAPIGMCTQIQVIGCRFDHAVSASIFNDHSTIYTSASEVVIADNLFQSPAPNTAGATCPIELHGSNQLAHHNVIKNYQIGCNFTGAAFRSDNLHFDHNVVDNAVYGVTIWSYFLGGNTTEEALTNSTISNNLIRLNRDAWPGVYQLSYGIGVEQIGNAPMRSIKVQNNEIYFAASALDLGAPDQYSCGIDWERGTAVTGPIGGIGYDRDIDISGNTIVGAYAAGIRIVAAIDGLTVAQNKIRENGNAVNALVTAHKSAIMSFANGRQSGWNFHHNEFTDRRVTPKMTFGFSHADAVAFNCRFEDNVFNVADLHPYGVLVGSFFTDSAYYVRHVCKSYGVAVAGLVRTGSTIIETDTGLNRIQVDAPEGANWLPTEPRVFPGYEIAWGKADATGGLESDDSLRFIPSTAAALFLGSASGGIPGHMVIAGNAGSTRVLDFYSGAIPRMGFYLDGAEGGANAGANMGIVNFSDLGAFLDSSIVFNRALGTDIDVFRPLDLNLVPLKYGGFDVIGARKTGWVIPVGTQSRASFDPATATTVDIGQRLNALIHDLFIGTGHATGHGAIGT